MDAVNQLIEQARTFFASMTPGARLTAGLLLAVVIVSVAYLFQQSTAGPDAYLFGATPLKTADLIAVETAIGQAGLSSYEIEGNRIRVPRTQKAEYIAAVAEAGAMPKGVADHMLEALDGGSMVDSRAVKQARLQAARERMLSKIITDMSFVSQASVMFSEEQVRGLNARKRVAATVAIQPVLGEDLDGRRVRNLQRTVAGWHPSLKPEQVTIVDQSDSSTYSGAGGGMSPDEFDDPYHRTLLAFENRIRGNILNHLSDIRGVRVQVSATLSPRVTAQVRSTKPEKLPLVSNSTTERQTTRQSTNAGGGRPGTNAQGPTRSDDNVATRINSKETDNSVEQTAELKGDTRTLETIAGLIPEEVQASVKVPRDHIVEVWKKRKLRETGEVPEQVDPQELATLEAEIVRNLEATVEPLLPDPPGAEDETKTVNVVVFDTVAAPEIEAPSVASEALFFASKHAGTAGMVALGLMGLIMLRSVVNGAPAGDGDGAPSLQLHTADGETVNVAGGEGEGDDEEAGPRLQLKKPESLKDDLAQIVRDDPDAAAAILRGWIGNAG